MARARKGRSTGASTVQAFGGAPPPTMPSADFCVAIRTPRDDLSPVTGTQHRPSEVRPTAFAARPPDLPPRLLMTVDFAINCSLVRPGRPRYPVLIHRAAVLLHASFRPRLATTPLRFANPSPPSGWIADSHLQAVDHARHTTKKPGAGRASAGWTSGRRVTSAQARLIPLWHLRRLQIDRKYILRRWNGAPAPHEIHCCGCEPLTRRDSNLSDIVGMHSRWNIPLMASAHDLT